MRVLLGQHALVGAKRRIRTALLIGILLVAGSLMAPAAALAFEASGEKAEEITPEKYPPPPEEEKTPEPTPPPSEPPPPELVRTGVELPWPVLAVSGLALLVAGGGFLALRRRFSATD